MNLSRDSIVVASASQVSSKLNADTVILHFDKGAYFGLNEVGTVVWEALQTPQTINSLRDAIVSEYDVEVERCEQDVLKLLEKLHQEGLIEVRSESDI